MTHETKQCSICKAPLIHRQTRPLQVCANPNCRARFAELNKDRICLICGKPLTDRERIQGGCSIPECRRQLARQKELVELREQRTQVLGRATAVRADAAEVLGVDDPESYAPATVPAFSARIVPLPAARRAAFVAHLRAVIAESFATGSVATDKHPMPANNPLDVLMGKGCATCRGYCCRTAGEHAYVMVGTIDRVRAQRPHAGPDEIANLFVDRLPDASNDGSCVFHTATGCTLPFEVRSDVCNTYFCEDLTAYSIEQNESSPTRAFFIAHERGVIRRAAFADLHSLQQFEGPAVDQMSS